MKQHLKRLALALLLLPAIFYLLACSKPAILTAQETDAKLANKESTVATAATAAAENAAPSQHISFSFPADAILKMHKIKITQSAHSSYFSVHNYAGGYAGLQQTSDPNYSTPNILISSLWDPNTAGGIFATASYVAPGTISSRFGGEGDGAKTINPYGWTLNTWYNIVLRSWKLNGKLYIATFIQNLSNNNWFHTSTLSIPERTTFLGSGNDSFLENWEGFTYDGRYVRKAFFKDCWNLNTSNTWQKHTSRSFSANAGDAYRNGIYHNAFNAGYDATQDAYFMEHGGSVTPSAAFNGGRTLALPVQTNQGTAPVLTVGAVSTVTASYAGGNVNVNWTNNATLSPQFSSKVEILNAAGTVLNTSDVILPERRSVTISASLASGNYTARVTITDIFNQVSAVATAAFTAGGSTGPIPNGTYRLVNRSTGKSLDNLGLSADGSGVGIYTNNTGNNQKWVLAYSGGYYRISSVSNAKSLDSGNNTADGSSIIQYTNNSGTNQQWTLVSAGGGYYRIVNRTNGKAMDSAGGTANGSFVKFWTVSSASYNQQWSIVVP